MVSIPRDRHRRAKGCAIQRLRRGRWVLSQRCRFCAAQNVVGHLPGSSGSGLGQLRRSLLHLERDGAVRRVREVVVSGGSALGQASFLNRAQFRLRHADSSGTRPVGEAARHRGERSMRCSRTGLTTVASYREQRFGRNATGAHDRAPARVDDRRLQRLESSSGRCIARSRSRASASVPRPCRPHTAPFRSRSRRGARDGAWRGLTRLATRSPSCARLWPAEAERVARSRHARRPSLRGSGSTGAELSRLVPSSAACAAGRGGSRSSRRAANSERAGSGRKPRRAKVASALDSRPPDASSDRDRLERRS